MLKAWRIQSDKGSNLSGRSLRVTSSAKAYQAQNYEKYCNYGLQQRRAPPVNLGVASERKSPKRISVMFANSWHRRIQQKASHFALYERVPQGLRWKSVMHKNATRFSEEAERIQCRFHLSHISIVINKLDLLCPGT